MEEKKPLVLAVAHDVKHPSFQKTLDWIEENVTPGMRVAIEWPSEDIFERKLPLGRRIMSRLKSIRTKQYLTNVSQAKGKPFEASVKFYRAVLDKVREKDGEVIPADSRELWKQTMAKEKELNSLEKLPLGHPGIFLMQHNLVSAIHNLHFKRSRYMLRESLGKNADVLIVGGVHAFHIQEYAPDLVSEVIPLFQDYEELCNGLRSFYAQRGLDVASAKEKFKKKP